MFSVIVPVYNNAHTIERCISSILEQTIGEYEIIIVNDGSTDDLLDVISIFRDDRIKIINQRNLGVSEARNRGIKTSIYPYICFLDADDLWLPIHIETLKGMIDSFPEEKLFVTAHRTIMLNGDRVDSNNFLKHDDETFLVDNLFKLLNETTETIIHTNSVCIERTCFSNVGFFEKGVMVGEDLDMWYRIAAYENIVFSKVITTERHREHSVATRFPKFNYHWIFEDRAKSLLKDEKVREDKKDAIVRFLDNRKISKSRHYIIHGNRALAKSELESMIYRDENKLKILVTKCCLFIPNGLIKLYLKIKHRNYYG